MNRIKTESDRKVRKKFLPNDFYSCETYQILVPTATKLFAITTISATKSETRSQLARLSKISATTPEPFSAHHESTTENSRTAATAKLFAKFTISATTATKPKKIFAG